MNRSTIVTGDIALEPAAVKESVTTVNAKGASISASSIMSEQRAACLYSASYLSQGTSI